MNQLFSKANKHVRKLVREQLESQEIEIRGNKIFVSAFKVSYNKGSRIEETMTDREILLKLNKTVLSHGEILLQLNKTVTTHGEMLLQISKDLSNVKEDLSNVNEDLSNVKVDLAEVKQDVKDMKNTPTMKKELKAMGEL